MPTVVPPPRVAVPVVSETEALASALAAGRASDFPAVRRSLDAVSDRAARARVSQAAVEALAAENPSNAAAVALALPSGSAQFSALEIVARAYVRQDANAAVQWAMGLTDPSAATVARGAVVADLVRSEPAAALNRLRELPASAARDDTLALAVSAWARNDADPALAWSRAVDDEALRQRLTFSAVFAIAQRTPARAAQLAESLPLGRDRGVIFSAVAQTWIATDPTAAMAWANRLPAGELREAALAGVDTGTGAAGRRKRNVGPRLNGGNRMGGTGVAAASGAVLPEQNHPAFAAWLAAQTRPMSRDEAIIEFIKQRGALDVGSIGDWISTLPGGPTRQRALETYFDQTLQTSPSAAASFLGSLSPSERSDAMVDDLARRWGQMDPNAAANWLRDSNLPQFRKEELIRNLPR